MKKRLFVNQYHIKHNDRRPGDQKPPITIESEDGVEFANECEVKGPCQMRYCRDKNNPGPRVWVETESDVEILS